MWKCVSFLRMLIVMLRKYLFFINMNNLHLSWTRVQASTLALAALCIAAVPAVAQDVAAGHGGADCRIGSLSPTPAGAVEWRGSCKDGFADGPGALSWRDADNKTVLLEGKLALGEIDGEATLTLGNGSQYNGPFKNGAPDGKGYFRDPDGSQYEGDVRNGERTGTGVWISELGDTYQGEWRNGKREGRGHLWYSVGGDYDGQWVADKRHGHGVLTYAGSGRKFEGEFVDGRIAGAGPQPEAERRYKAFGFNGTMQYMPEVAKGSAVPPAVGYGELTPEQKRLVNSFYPALEEGDEPPYPFDGPQAFYEHMAKVTTRFKAEGKLILHANVGVDGKVTTVRMAGLQDPQVRRQAAAAAAALKYKPAVCRGQPCAMGYRFNLQLGLPR
jgi:hypothetical protein